MSIRIKSMLSVLTVALALLAATPACTADVSPSAASDHALELDDLIRAADQAEVQAILHGDADAQARLWADDFVVTSAHGEVLVRDQVMSALARGVLPYRSFERLTEEVRMHGDFALSLGREQVTPSAAPEGVAVVRRYTHFWAKRDGRWQLVARHASVVNH